MNVLMLEKELQKVSTLVATVQAPPVPEGLGALPTSGISKKVEVFTNLGYFMERSTTLRNGG